MKALVLSGGGAKGAFTGGMLEYMKKEMGKEYDLYVATSTGTLLQTLTSINEFDALKEAYTTMNLDDIYKISPFKQGKSTDSVGSLNIWSLIKMIFFKKEPTFGDSSNLKKLIHKYFTKEKYLKSLDEGKNLVVCVTNISRAREEYYSSQDLGSKGYNDFCDWTWISSNAVPFTSIVRRGRDNDYYADGGFMEHVPIKKAIELGATEIDVISTKTERYSGDPEVDFGNNPLKLLERLFDITMKETSDRDIEAAKNMAKENAVTVKVYNFPRKLTDNSMYFDESQMLGWWEEGYHYAKSLDKDNEFDKVCKTIKMRPKKKKS
jgi:predicted patatin/cPLA2 family phospholipase